MLPTFLNVLVGRLFRSHVYRAKKKKKKKALQALVPLFAKLCELLVWLGGGSHRHDGQGTIHKAFVCRHETGARCPWSPEALQASGLEVLDIQF